MGAKALHMVVADALNFAAPASLNIPAIATVRIEATDGRFVSIATDRYVLGVSRVDYTGEAFSLTVDVDDAKNLARIAKTVKRAGRRAPWRSTSTTTRCHSGSAPGKRSPSA
jgi:hypothetical protein